MIPILTFLQVIFTSLGVGASTVASFNFFKAIDDGTIDQSEREMMGVTYVILRVAMVGILFTQLSFITVGMIDSTFTLTIPLFVNMFIVAVLYGNALLMTSHKMPSTYGPGIQAGSWYMLGLLQAAAAAGWVVTQSLLTHTLLGYAVVVFLVIVFVNTWIRMVK